ncbi:DUF5723 family protein [Hymenobacter psychrotolerans]|uniref:DUF5723 family protein n=1 Tax=Hymenobacter psychrotolerans TaxID=344998 RepID=UPI001114A1D1|nr:DUF5723 family protein [Hymenobacter psychrotolerans]
MRIAAPVLAGCLLGASSLRAQNELGNFSTAARGGVATTFVTDFQAIGVNPANLGRQDNARVAFTIAEFGVGVGSQSLTRTQLRKFIENSDETLTLAQKQEMARAFTSDNVLNLNADATPIAFSVVLPLVGSFAVSSRQRVTTHLGLNKNTAELLWLGKDAPIYPANFNPATAPLISEVLDGTSVQLAAYNEYNIAYGRQVLRLPSFSLSVGAGYRYVQGVGVVDVRASGGKLEAYSALSPQFNVDYGSVASNPSFNLRQDADKLIQPVGRGHGYDLGVAAEVGKKLRLGASVTDIGTMRWEGNLLTANDQRLKRLRSSGANSYEFLSELENIFASGTDSLFQYTPAQERNASLPTKLRLGAGLRVGTRLEVGADVTMPLNEVAGNLPNAFYGVALDVKPVSWIRLSTGLTTGAGYGLGLPVGFAIATKIYELGIGTRDLRGLLSDNKPYASVAVGTLRFKFGTAR